MKNRAKKKETMQERRAKIDARNRKRAETIHRKTRTATPNSSLLDNTEHPPLLQTAKLDALAYERNLISSHFSKKQNIVIVTNSQVRCFTFSDLKLTAVYSFWEFRRKIKSGPIRAIFSQNEDFISILFSDLSILRLRLITDKTKPLSRAYVGIERVSALNLANPDFVPEYQFSTPKRHNPKVNLLINARSCGNIPYILQELHDGFQLLNPLNQKRPIFQHFKVRDGPFKSSRVDYKYHFVSKLLIITKKKFINLTKFEPRTKKVLRRFRQVRAPIADWSMNLRDPRYLDSWFGGAVVGHMNNQYVGLIKNVKSGLLELEMVDLEFGLQKDVFVAGTCAGYSAGRVDLWCLGPEGRVKVFAQNMSKMRSNHVLTRKDESFRPGKGTKSPGIRNIFVGDSGFLISDHEILKVNKLNFRVEKAARFAADSTWFDYYDQDTQTLVKSNFGLIQLFQVKRLKMASSGGFEGVDYLEVTHEYKKYILDPDLFKLFVNFSKIDPKTGNLLYLLKNGSLELITVDLVTGRFVRSKTIPQTQKIIDMVHSEQANLYIAKTDSKLKIFDSDCNKLLAEGPFTPEKWEELDLNVRYDQKGKKVQIILNEVKRSPKFYWAFWSKSKPNSAHIEVHQNKEEVEEISRELKSKIKVTESWIALFTNIACNVYFLDPETLSVPRVYKIKYDKSIGVPPDVPYSFDLAENGNLLFLSFWYKESIFRFEIDKESGEVNGECGEGGFGAWGASL